MASLLVTHTSHFLRGPDERVYARNTLLSHSFWSRYLAAFDQVGVAARVGRVKHVPAGLPRACGDGVAFCDLPDYLGPGQYLRNRGALSSRLCHALDTHDAYCLRVPCAIATLAWKELRRRGRSFGLEIVGDPRESLSRGAVRYLVRPLACRLAARDLRRQCAEAKATAYVTERTLQQRYPPDPGAFTTHYSSVELHPDAFADQPRCDFADARRLVFVGTLAVPYKGTDVLIRAVSQCTDRPLRLTIVGDGRERPRLEALVRSLGLAGRVTFLGHLPAGKPVREVLDAADLFVLPSRADALPRAMIEAMARGLPCIGSNVGGIPELLLPEALVMPGSVTNLAQRITEFLSDPVRMAAASRRNLEAARSYLAPVLAARRKEFYDHLRELSDS